jgi:dihydroorotate dehydrogenase electron transfer subunit
VAEHALPTQERATVLRKERLAGDHVRLVLDAPRIAPWTRAGQFVHVLCPPEARLRQFAQAKGRVLAPGQSVSDSSHLPLLRRPLSVHRLCGREYMQDRLRSGPFSPGPPGSPRQCTGLELLFRVVGTGTAALAQRESGETVDLIGPLGNGFVVGPNAAEAVLVAGGIGVAPLLALAQELRLLGRAVTALVGTVAADKMPLGVDPQLDRSFADEQLDFMLREFDQIGARSVLVGEREHGMLVTEYLEPYLERHRARVEIYACGPKAMLAEVVRIAGGRPCQVLLEERMACGLGACRGCVVKVRVGGRPRFRTVCKDGPVFRGQDILWDETT